MSYRDSDTSGGYGEDTSRRRDDDSYGGRDRDTYSSGKRPVCPISRWHLTQASQEPVAV